MSLRSASEFRAWIRRIETHTLLTASEIARASGLAESTLTRHMKPDSSSIPRASTIAKIEHRFGTLTRSKSRVEEEPVAFDHDLKSEAEALGLNANAIAEKAIKDAINRRRFEAWIDDNKDAFAAHRKDVEENGLWSDGLRAF